MEDIIDILKEEIGLGRECRRAGHPRSTVMFSTASSDTSYCPRCKIFYRKDTYDEGPDKYKTR